MRSQTKQQRQAARLRQDRNFNALGKISSVVLAMSGLLVINPTSTPAHAYTPEEREEGSAVSSVSISFSPSSGSATLSPTTAAGASGLVSVLASVGVSNSGGYSVYLGSNDTNLVGSRSSNATVIPGVSGAVSFDNLQDNTWGYTAVEGASIPESATYKSVSKGQGDAIFTNNNSRIQNEHKTFALGFATKITNDIPADTYENQVILSVVSSPYQLTLMDIDDMQEMTSNICENSEHLATKQLRDIRDGKYYWVTKLADGKCWMTQNLDLDLSTKIALTPNDSDVTTNWMPGFDTATEATAETVNPIWQTETRSWSLGNYRITNPTIPNDCGYPKNDLSACTAQFTSYATPTMANEDELAHYTVGNYYSWNAATAGTGGSITSGQATSSICPKGWKLPESNAATTGTFGGLINAYSISSDVAKLISAPLYFVRGGLVWQNVDLFSNGGNGGYYWSSTPISNGTYAHSLDLSATNVVGPSSTNDRRLGFSVRCLAR